jgi:hypothetical protein
MGGEHDAVYRLLWTRASDVPDLVVEVEHLVWSWLSVLALDKHNVAVGLKPDVDPVVEVTCKAVLA